MQIKLILGVIICLAIVAVVSRPFSSKGKIKELGNHLLVAFGAYYGSYTIMKFSGVDATTGMALAAGATAVVTVLYNMFSRKPEGREP